MMPTHPLSSSLPVATVIITTCNRREDLAGAVRSALAQVPPVTVLIVDDGSTDGTSDMVRVDFPEVWLERRETSAGYIVRRNEAARLARTPFLVSIDDDAAFAGLDSVARAVAEFSHPRIGAVAIPFVNVNEDSIVRQRAPDDSALYITHVYIGTAHALRRDLFLRLGGYREFLHYQFEEQDFCVRMLEAGYAVRLGSADPIQHFQSPRRMRDKIVFYGARNQLLLAWLNSAEPLRPLAGVLWRCLWGTLRRGRLGPTVRGLTRGLIDGWKLRAQRRPVRRETQTLSRSLMAKPRACTPLELEALLSSS